MSAFEDWELHLLRTLDGPLPLVPRPFEAVAEAAGLDEQTVLERVRSWVADGVIRRFGARVNHLAAGYRANGMSVWNVPEERVEAAGCRMAEFEAVSHCYARPRLPDWPYNLYAMIHGAREEEVRAVAARIAEAIGIEDYTVLFSGREFKKTAPQYFVDDEDKP